VSVDVLARSALAVVGLETTTSTPPLILTLAVAHVRLPGPVEGPWVFWVRPDVSWQYIRQSARPNVTLAPSWSEVAERFTDLVGDRVLVVADAWDAEVLRAHLPDWQPAGIVFAREIAEQVWPHLDDHDLPRRSGADVQAYALLTLIPELVHDAALPPDQRRGGGATEDA
jgi:exodeoxyribonuclease X